MRQTPSHASRSSTFHHVCMMALKKDERSPAARKCIAPSENGGARFRDVLYASSAKPAVEGKRNEREEETWYARYENGFERMMLTDTPFTFEASRMSRHWDSG